MNATCVASAPDAGAAKISCFPTAAALQLHKQCVHLRMVEREIHKRCILEKHGSSTSAITDNLRKLNLISYQEKKMCLHAGCTNLCACVAPVRAGASVTADSNTDKELDFCTLHAFQKDP
jgi:hypothetical protein